MNKIPRNQVGHGEGGIHFNGEREYFTAPAGAHNVGDLLIDPEIKPGTTARGGRFGPRPVAASPERVFARIVDVRGDTYYIERVEA